MYRIAVTIQKIADFWSYCATRYWARIDEMMLITIK